VSRFVSDAVRKELDAKREDLCHAYLRANEDEGQKEAIKEGEATVTDGSNEG